MDPSQAIALPLAIFPLMYPTAADGICAETLCFPFGRNSSDAPKSIRVDEWYALLPAEFLPLLDLGARIRCRQVAYSVIPR